MPGPKAPTIELDDAQRAALEQLVRAHSTAQTLVTRACCILLASEGMTTTEIGRQLGLEADTVRVWRARWRACAHIPLAECSVAARLADAPRAGAPARITPEHICQIVALSCETPAESERPISQWSDRELANEIVKRGIVDRISPRHAGRLLKRTGLAAPPDPLLAQPAVQRARSRTGSQDHGRV